MSCKDSDCEDDDGEDGKNQVTFVDEGGRWWWWRQHRTVACTLCLPQHEFDRNNRYWAKQSRESTVDYSWMYHVSTGKCQELWNLVNRSPKTSNTVKNSWRHFCTDSLCHKVEFHVQRSPMACWICRQTCRDEWWTETVEVHPPIQEGFYKGVRQGNVGSHINTWSTEGDQKCFFGMLPPKLIQLRNRLKRKVRWWSTDQGIVSSNWQRFETLLNLDLKTWVILQWKKLFVPQSLICSISWSGCHQKGEMM